MNQYKCRIHGFIKNKDVHHWHYTDENEKCDCEPVEAKAEAGELNLQNIINILDEESADISKSISSEDIANRILQLARPSPAANTAPDKTGDSARSHSASHSPTGRLPIS